MKIDHRRYFTMLIVTSLLFVAFNVSAQQKQQGQSKCPATKVTCPDTVNAGDKLTFTADVRGGDSQVTPTYNWTVSAGSIESGQGTSTIEVNTSEVAPDSTVTATVDLGGFDRECGYGSTASSCTTSVLKKVASRKLDEYGALNAKEESARLDNFALELNSDMQAQGHVIAYGGRSSREGDARKAAEKVREYLVSKRGLDRQRVTIVDGGYREQPTVELWLVPSGAEPPKPTPTVEPGKAKPTKPKTTKSRKM